MSLISSQEIVTKYQISYQTLCFYTNLGLLAVSKRQGHRRLYDSEEIKNRLDKINRLKDDGYPLRIIVRELSKNSDQTGEKVPGAMK